MAVAVLPGGERGRAPTARLISTDAVASAVRPSSWPDTGAGLGRTGGRFADMADMAGWWWEALSIRPPSLLRRRPKCEDRAPLAKVLVRDAIRRRRCGSRAAPEGRGWSRVVGDAAPAAPRHELVPGPGWTPPSAEGGERSEGSERTLARSPCPRDRRSRDPRGRTPLAAQVRRWRADRPLDRHQFRVWTAYRAPRPAARAPSRRRRACSGRRGWRRAPR